MAESPCGPSCRRHHGDQAQQLAERQQLGERLGVAGERLAELLLGVARGRSERRNLGAQPGELLAERAFIHWWRRNRRHALVDEIPVGLEVLGHETDTLFDTEVVVLAQLDEAHRLGIVEQCLEEVGETFVERGGALHFVEHAELGR